MANEKALSWDKHVRDFIMGYRSVMAQICMSLLNGKAPKSKPRVGATISHHFGSAVIQLIAGHFGIKKQKRGWTSDVRLAELFQSCYNLNVPQSSPPFIPTERERLWLCFRH